MANKESEKLKSESIEIEYNSERFTVEGNYLLVSSSLAVAGLQREQLRLNDAFHTIKDQALRAYSTKLSETTLLTDLSIFFHQFKEDLAFYLGKVKLLVKESDFKVLVEVRETQPEL